MHASSKNIVSLLMLVIFLAGVGASGFQSKWFAHAFDHDRQALGVSADDHHHAHQHDTGGDPDQGPLSDIEHQLLHAADHFPPLLINSIPDGFGESSARMDHVLSRLLPLPPAQSNPPFRPPRFTSRI